MDEEQVVIKKDEVPDSDEINLFDLIVVCFKRKRLIMAFALDMAAVAIVACMVLTPVYQGTAQITPPQESSATSSMLSQFAGVVGSLTGLSGATQSPSDVFVGLLKSYSVLDTVIDRFGLIEEYKMKRFLGQWRKYSLEDARDDLLSYSNFESDSTSGLVTITVEDNDPKKSSEIANGFVDELKKLLVRMASAEAGERRAFFDNEFKRTVKTLTGAEEDVKKFEESTGAIMLDDQARAVMQGIATLEAQVAAKEIQLKVMKTYLTENNPEYKRALQELQGLRQERKKFEENDEYFKYSNAIIPTGTYPTLGTEYLRKQRTLKYQQTLYDILLKQYEAARLDQEKKSSNVNIVTVAKPSERVYKPKLPMATALLTILGLFLGVVTAFTVEAINGLFGNTRNKGRSRLLGYYLRRM